MNSIPPITTTLTELQTWMVTHAPGMHFRPPVDPRALDNFEEKSSITLPKSLRQTLLIMDGETRSSAGMIGNWRLMPIAEIQAAWGLLTKVAEKGAFGDQSVKPSPYLRKSWWCRAWIPIVTSDQGDYFCLDTDPPEAKRAGQILLFFQNRPERPLIAGSLPAWFDRILRDLIAGQYKYDNEQGFDGEAFLWSALEGKHLLDDIKGTLVVKE